MKDEMMTDVFVTRALMVKELGLYGLATMQVCAYSEVPPEQVEARANELNPNGLRHPWRIIWGNDESDDMNNAAKAPIQCGQQPERIHYLLGC